MNHIVSIRCRDCLDKWVMVCREEALFVVVGTHRRASHEGKPISYCVSPVDEYEPAEVGG